MSQLRSGRLLGGLNSNARVLATADFRAPLYTSLALTRGTGAPTYTRATTGTVVDHEGVIRTCLAGEARFTGARRVRNLIGASETDVSCVKEAGVSASVTAGFWTVSLPAGSSSEGRLYFPTGAANGVNARKLLFHAKMASTSAVTVHLRMQGNTSLPQDAAMAVTTTPTTFTLTVWTQDASDTGSYAIFWAPSPCTITISEIQVEDITGQSIQTAGEYVSVGIVQRNKWTYSAEFDNAVWTKTYVTVVTNDAVAPDGTASADKLINDNTSALLDRTLTVTANTVHTDSVYLKYGNNVWVRILYGTGVDAVQLWVNIQTGVIGTVVTSNGTATMSAYSIVAADNGFWRIQATVALGGGITVFQRRVYLVNADNSGTIVSAAYAHHWGAQIEVGAVATEYQANGGSYIYHGTGVDGVKCFDTTLAGEPIPAATLKGYLSEPARTNLLLRSQAFELWGGSNVTVTDSGIASPIVGVNFQKLTATTTSATNCSQAVVGAGSTSGNTYSVYVKKGSGATECNRFNFYNNTTGQDLYRVTFNYGTGVFSAPGGTGTASVDTFANGVYRLKLTNTGGVSNGDALSVYCGFPGNTETAGKYLYAIGAQLEVGPYASSYIPTTTAAVTRNADVLTYPSAGNISDTAGTSYVAFSAQGITGANQQILARDTNGRFPYVNSFPDRTQLYDGTTQNNATAGPSFVNSTQKSAQSWGAGTKSISYAGTAIVSSAYDGTQGTGAIAIGCNNAGTEQLGGNVGDVCIWTRTLPDAVLKRISK